jgi:ubiquinone biosynthesis protein
MKRDLPRELDYTLEAKNCIRCAEVFKDDPRVKVPKIYNDYTRERVLVMSHEAGIPVTHVKRM